MVNLKGKIIPCNILIFQSSTLIVTMALVNSHPDTFTEPILLSLMGPLQGQAISRSLPPYPYLPFDRDTYGRLILWEDYRENLSTRHPTHCGCIYGRGEASQQAMLCDSKTLWLWWQAAWVILFSQIKSIFLSISRCIWLKIEPL